MAKGDTKTQHVRTPRPKTAAQLAKRDDNIHAYLVRNRRLREDQELANNLRKQGYRGNDKQVLETYRLEQKVKKAARYCMDVYNCPEHGPRIQRWLGDRMNLSSPLEVEKLIRDFLDRDGFNRDRSTYNAKYDNSEMKLAVLKWLADLYTVQPVALNSELKVA